MKKQIINFVLNLQFIFKPKYWTMNDYYNKELDILMNILYDSYSFTEIGEHTAFLGNTEIWIANKPYACMIPYECSNLKVRPSRLTIKKGLDKLNKELISKLDIDNTNQTIRLMLEKELL